MRLLLAATLLGLCGCAGVPRAAPGPRPPRLLATPEEVLEARRWMGDYPWYREHVEALKRQAEPYLSRPLYISPLKWRYADRGYQCPADGTELAFEADRPFEHACPKCGALQRGGKYDDAWAGRHHLRLSEALLSMGVLHQLTGEARYARYVREAVTAYAREYRHYPEADNILGPARVLCGTHLETAGWGLNLVLAYDLTNADPVWTGADRALVRRELFLPLAALARRFDETVSNREVWYTVMVAAVGYLYEDEALVRDALEGPRGFRYLLSVGLPSDGLWYEGTGYHAYAFKGFAWLAEMARRSGTDLYAAAPAGRSLRSMLDGLIRCAKPDLGTPGMRDSGGVSLLDAAGIYEIGWLRYGDPRYAAVLRGARRDPPFFTLCRPELPEGPPFSAPGESALLEGNGIALLRDRVAGDPRLLCLDYGIVGGEHGQPERLSLACHALGRDWLSDPGNDSYFQPSLQTWYRQTVAHNAPVVDRRSQGWGNGRLRGYRSLPGLQWASGESDRLYGGVLLRRTVVSLGEYFVDLLEAESDSPRVFDLPYHGIGTLELGGAGPGSPGPGPGYDEMTGTGRADPEGPWAAAFTAPDGAGLLVAGFAETLFHALVPGGKGHHDERRPSLLARREGRKARFVHLLHPFAASPAVSGFAEEGEGRFRVRIGPETHHLLLDPRGLRFSVLRERDGRPVSAALTGLDRLEAGGACWLEAPGPLKDGASLAWEGEVLRVEARGFGRLRVRAPGVRRVLLNGREAGLERDGDWVRVSEPGPPAVRFPGMPQDLLVLYKGIANPVALELSAGEAGFAGRLSLRALDGWREEARRQRLDWGGIVNLKAENRGPALRTLTPLDRLEDADPAWLEAPASAPLDIPPGGDGLASLVLCPPSPLPDAEIPGALLGEGLRVPRRIRLEDPVSLELSFPNGPRTLLRATLLNRTPRLLSAEVEVDPGGSWTLEGPSRFTVPLEPGEERRLDLPVSLARRDARRQAYPLSARVRCGGFEREVGLEAWAAEAVRLERPPRLGEAFGEPLRIGGAEQRARLLMGSLPWGGASDLLATVRLGYDDRALYLALEVQDDVVVPEPLPAHLYPSDADSAVLTLDLRADGAQQREPRTDGCFRHLLVPALPEVLFPPGTRGDVPLPYAQVPGARTAWERTRGGYRMLVTLPGMQAPEGTKAGFDLALNDNDGGSYRKNQFIWAGYSENQSWADLRWIGMLLFR